MSQSTMPDFVGGRLWELLTPEGRAVIERVLTGELPPSVMHDPKTPRDAREFARRTSGFYVEAQRAFDAARNAPINPDIAREHFRIAAGERPEGGMGTVNLQTGQVTRPWRTAPEWKFGAGPNMRGPRTVSINPEVARAVGLSEGDYRANTPVYNSPDIPQAMTPNEFIHSREGRGASRREQAQRLLERPDQVEAMLKRATQSGDPRRAVAAVQSLLANATNAGTKMDPERFSEYRNWLGAWSENIARQAMTDPKAAAKAFIDNAWAGGQTVEGGLRFTPDALPPKSAQPVRTSAASAAPASQIPAQPGFRQEIGPDTAPGLAQQQVPQTNGRQMVSADGGSWTGPDLAGAAGLPTVSTGQWDSFDFAGQRIPDATQMDQMTFEQHLTPESMQAIAVDMMKYASPQVRAKVNGVLNNPQLNDHRLFSPDQRAAARSRLQGAFAGLAHEYLRTGQGMLGRALEANAKAAKQAADAYAKEQDQAAKEAEQEKEAILKEAKSLAEKRVKAAWDAKQKAGGSLTLPGQDGGGESEVMPMPTPGDYADALRDVLYERQALDAAFIKVAMGMDAGQPERPQQAPAAAQDAAPSPNQSVTFNGGDAVVQLSDGRKVPGEFHRGTNRIYPSVSTPYELKGLPSGTVFIAPDGSLHRKD